MQTALKMLEEHQARASTLRKALVKGENSDVAGPINIDAYLAKRRAEWQSVQDKRRS